MIQEEVREYVAHITAQQLRDREHFLKVYPPEYKVGPMGGEQQTIVAAYDDGEEVHGIIVSVYCDERCLDVLKDKVQVQTERKELRKALLDE